MFIFIFTLVSVIYIFILYKQFNSTYSYWKVRNVPYIKPAPLFGSVFRICIGRESIGSLFYNIYKASNNPIEGFFVFHKPWLLIRDLDVIKSIFVKDFDCFSDRASACNPRDDEIGSNTLFVLQNPHWKYVRAKISPSISPAHIKQFYPHVNNIGNELLIHINRKCSESNSLEISTISAKYVTDILALFSFGIDSRSFQQVDGGDFFKVGKRIHHHGYWQNLQMTLYSLAPFLVKRFRMKLLEPTAARFLRDIFWNVFKEAELNPKMGGELMQYLVHLKRQNQASKFLFDGDPLVAQSVQFFVAGLDTSSVTISYALYELSIRPDIQDRVRSEITNWISNSKSISYDSLSEMHYLDMVIYETLRKYPAFPFVDRTCTQDYTLPGSNITIPKGNQVCISLLGLHYDPKYFPNPENFNPERFTKEGICSRPSCCFLPFSTGPRICIGERFAFITIKVALIKIISGFIVELSENTALKFSHKSLAIVPHDGINLKFTKIT